ncbi:MAG TPA: HD domain-containing protein [Acetobacteraceae bacterium]|jgi:(p)ppGpp synthase/HD superfamily hydrolase|nr:HD domain-containing protein [Acetobacteraceae bacterium]
MPEASMARAAGRGMVEVLHAAEVAAGWHAAQRRKGDAAEPYINHLLEVAALLGEATGGDDPALVIAGLLHDSIEDCGILHSEIEARFGADVAALVDAVTDDKSLPKLERKRLQIEHAAEASARAKMLKLADKISNLRALAASPPAGWPPARQQEYLTWARAVVAGTRGVNGWLEAAFDRAAAEAERKVFFL